MGDLGKSEDIYGERVDRCLYSGMMKLIGGSVLGVVSSVVLFKRQPWPVVLGFGGGIGSAITSCSYEFKYGSTLPLNRAPQIVNGAHQFYTQPQNNLTSQIQQRNDDQYRSYTNMKNYEQQRYKALQPQHHQGQPLGWNWPGWPPQQTSHDQSIVRTFDIAQEEESIPCQDIVEVGSDEKEGGNDVNDDEHGDELFPGQDCDDYDGVDIGYDEKESFNDEKLDELKDEFCQNNFGNDEEEGVNTENNDESDETKYKRLKRMYPMSDIKQ